VIRSCDSDTALTILALVSEDPADWDQAMSVWPRYWTRPVGEFVSNLPIEPASREEAIEILKAAEAWVVVDFPSKRLLTGGSYMKVGRHEVFAMEVDEEGNQQSPMSVCIPPWWEMHEGVEVDWVHQPRQSSIVKPHVDREVLYGDALVEDLASRILDVVASDEWKNSEASEKPKARYPFTVRVHRDWLMTPRGDLGGRMPRQLLHGAFKWVDQVTFGQQLRMQEGRPAIAAPNDWPSFATAPMGSQEVCIYFDLCRELINAGWAFCVHGDSRLMEGDRESARGPLVELLRVVKDDWLEESFEGGAPPRIIIECDRRRVPRATGVAIDGIEGMEETSRDEKGHVIDCDCPICEMMADGVFGIGFTALDGHHLEEDEEFAFSLIETREEWEKEQQENAAFRAEYNREAYGEESSDEEDDPFASAWSGIHTDGPIPGDRRGHLKMAFMVAEVVGSLESLEANHDDIKSLNQCFANYRRSDDEQRPGNALRFKAMLQSLADRYPSLISKSADLQSHIDEAERA
jgi:hypothetical protein